MGDSKKIGFSEEVEKLKTLLNDGDITEKQYEKAKEQFLSGFGDEEDNDKDDYEDEEESAKKNASTYYIFVTFATILSIAFLGGGIVTGAIMGGVLGVLGYLIGKSTSKLLSKYLVFIFLTIIINFLIIYIINPPLYEANSSTNIVSNSEAEYISAYYDCSDSSYEAYHSRWEETCLSKGEEANCFLPNDIVVIYDESLQNDLDRCAVRYEDKISKNDKLYNSCRDDAYDSYHERWNEKCENMGEEDDCQLPSITAEAYEDTLQRSLDRCLLLFQ